MTTTDSNINCHNNTGSCSFTYASGAVVTFNQSPDSNVVFGAWSGDCSGSGACSITMSAAHSVTGTFINTRLLTITAVSGSGTVTSSPAGINCTELGGTCSARFNEGTVVNLTEVPTAGWLFSAWDGDCTGAGACSLTLNGDPFVGATFLGPFDFSLGTTLPNNLLSMVQGESRSFPVSVTLTAGAALPVALSVTGLPSGVTAAFAPSTLTPNGSSTLTLTASAGATLGQATINITGVNGTNSRSIAFDLTVVSPRELDAPYGLALEAGGTTALVTDNGTGGNAWHRLVRIDASTRFVVKTIAEYAAPFRRMTLEAGATAALVASTSGLLRITLATGAVTELTTPNAIRGVEGVSIEAGGGTALVTNCGPTNNCNAGRLDRVNLSTGAITTLTTVGLQFPQGIAVEPSGTTAVLAEQSSGRVLRVTLSNGALFPLTTGFTLPTALTLEAGGTSALVTHLYGAIVRVDLATGIATDLESPPEVDIQGIPSLALEAGGTRALVVHQYVGGRVTRVPINTSLRQLEPAVQSLEVLYSSFGVAIEPGGATALATDCGSASCGLNTGRVVRIDLSTGVVTPIATGLGRLRAIALEPGGTSALFVDDTAGAGLLQRIILASGTVTTITGINSPSDVVPETNGTTALVMTTAFGGGAITRVNLSTGAKTPLVSFPGCFQPYGMALEAGGGTVLATSASLTGCSGSLGLARVDLGTGAVTSISIGMQRPVGVAIEAGGATALVTDTNGSSGFSRLLRVDLATGVFSVVGPKLGATSLGGGGYGNAEFLKIEASGAALVATSDGRLVRVTDAPIVSASVARALDDPRGFAILPASALVLDCGGLGDCTVHGRLSSVALSTGALTPIVTTLNSPNALTLEAGGATALITGCGPSSQDCAIAGRVLRVTLATGALALVGGGLNHPDGIAIEAGGASALVAERGSNSLLRLDLASGTVTVVAASLGGVRSVVIESGGSTALVVANNALLRVNLLASGATSIVATVVIERFVVEAGGATALVAWSSGQLGRVNLTTGAVTVLAMPHFDRAHSLAFDPTGSNLYFTDNVGSSAPAGGYLSGTLFRIPAP